MRTQTARLQGRGKPLPNELAASKNTSCTADRSLHNSPFLLFSPTGLGGICYSRTHAAAVPEHPCQVPGIGGSYWSNTSVWLDRIPQVSAL